MAGSTVGRPRWGAPSLFTRRPFSVHQGRRCSSLSGSPEPLLGCREFLNWLGPQWKCRRRRPRDPGPRPPRAELERRHRPAHASGRKHTGSVRTIPLLTEPVLRGDDGQLRLVASPATLSARLVDAASNFFRAPGRRRTHLCLPQEAPSRAPGQPGRSQRRCGPGDDDGAVPHRPPWPQSATAVTAVRRAARCTGLSPGRVLGLESTQLESAVARAGVTGGPAHAPERRCPAPGTGSRRVRHCAHVAPGRSLRPGFASRAPPEVFRSPHIGETGESVPTGRGQGHSHGQAAFLCARAPPRTTRGLRGSGPAGGRQPPGCCVPARRGLPGTTVPGAGADRGDSR
ncbi:hypothetical protein SAMN06272775_0302 [Streptomyces sp. 2323.1]|nr:hypothetical protein SAMN06272775_0302 [Streptomyces sp. 2323.1]